MSNSRPRLSAFGRSILVSRIQAGWSLRRAAAALGVSATWAWVIWHRFVLEGTAALVIRSSRPHRSPRRLQPRIEARIERARRRKRWGPLRLQWLLGIARSTIYAVLRRLGIARRRDLDPKAAPARRYERPVPGDLVHIDTKKIGRLQRGGGKRIWELKRTGPRHHGAGWEYVHVAIDDRSRVWYVERLRSEGADAVAAFTARALAYFADRGVRVRQVMTDNAFSYVHGRLFQALLAAWGIEHVRIPAYTPRGNGKAEAAVGILLREWAYARPYLSNRARAVAFARFAHSYNHRRPHGELGGLTPMQRLLADINDVRGQYN
jgi:transposase InsO family protein